MAHGTRQLSDDCLFFIVHFDFSKRKTLCFNRRTTDKT